MTKPEMTQAEFQFYEWLIIAKGITGEHFKTLTDNEFSELKAEWNKLLIIASNQYTNLII